MTTALKILAIGRYGIFGGRLVELLENEPRLTLIVSYDGWLEPIA